MDCNNIRTRLNQIRKEAQGARHMLDEGNTGSQFETALEVIELHLQAIRAEVATLVRTPGRRVEFPYGD